MSQTNFLQNTSLQFDGLVAAFQALAKTAWLAASTSSARIALAAVSNQVQVFNNTTAVCYVAWGQDNTITASAGSAGTSTSDYPVAPGSVVVCTVPAGTTYAAAILSTGSGQVTFTPGVGV